METHRKIPFWTEEQVKEFTEKCVEEYYQITPSAIVLKSYYVGCDWRFDKMRGFVEQEVQIVKQRISKQMGI